MASLSRDTQSSGMWGRASADMGLSPNHAIWVERFQLINRACTTIAGLFYNLFANEYMTQAIVSTPASGNYSTATGTWTAATSTLVQTMNAVFTAADVGKCIVFKTGSTVSIGFIATYVSATTVTLTGGNLPSGNTVPDNFTILLSTPPSGDSVDISTLRIFRAGEQIKTQLNSSSTNTQEAVSLEDYLSWRTDGDNINKIAYSISGDTLLLKKGDAILSYGTLTLYYPRVPYLVTADTDYIDIPDGSATEIALIYAQKLIAQRVAETGGNVKIPDRMGEILMHAQLLYQNYGQMQSAEVIQSKIKALL